MQNMYVLNLLRVEERTEESFQKGLELENFKYNREVPLDKYKERILSWNQYADKYELTIREENSYFLNLFDAQYSAKTNCYDINEAGVYNYVCIIGYPIGLVYGNCEPTDFYLYKYNRETDYYDEVSSDEYVYKFVAKEVGASFLINDENKNCSFNLFESNVIPKLDEIAKKNNLQSAINQIYIFMYRFGFVFDLLLGDASKMKPFDVSLSSDNIGISLDWNLGSHTFHFVFEANDKSYMITETNFGVYSKNKKEMSGRDYSFYSMECLLELKKYGNFEERNREA